MVRTEEDKFKLNLDEFLDELEKMPPTDALKKLMRPDLDDVETMISLLLATDFLDGSFDASLDEDGDPRGYWTRDSGLSKKAAALLRRMVERLEAWKEQAEQWETRAAVLQQENDALRLAIRKLEA